jgi:hypothetical protein
MNKKIYSLTGLLTVLIAFTVADGINNYNSGVYADTHGLGGGDVGWFHPFGVIVFAITTIATIGLGIYISSQAHKK